MTIVGATLVVALRRAPTRGAPTFSDFQAGSSQLESPIDGASFCSPVIYRRAD